MGNEFEGKVAVVTGSSGIGLGAALKLAHEGAAVYICGIDDDHNANARARGEGLNFTVSCVDVANETAVSDWMNWIGNIAGGIDILVNAAVFKFDGVRFWRILACAGRARRSYDCGGSRGRL